MSDGPWSEAQSDDGPWHMKRRFREDGRRVQVLWWKLGPDGQRVVHSSAHFARATWRVLTGEVPIVTNRGATP